MKKATYFSVLLAVLFLAISLISIFLEQNYHSLLLPLGIGCLLLVTLPLILVQFRDHSSKLRRQRKAHDNLTKKKGSNPEKVSAKSTPNYPSFGSRKSGLTWGGGNIHASTAKRGSKKRFLQK